MIQYMIYVMKPSLRILWKTKITSLIGKVFLLIFKQKHIFFYSWKSIFWESLRIQLPQYFFFPRQILKNIDMSQQTPHHLLTTETSFIKVETAILMKCGFCFYGYKMVTWWFTHLWILIDPNLSFWNIPQKCTPRADEQNLLHFLTLAQS